MSADLALINANVRTMNPRQPVAQAVAITNNKISKVGTNQEIKSFIDKNTRVIDLKGKTVLPGLIDTHVHVVDFGRCLLWLDLTTAKSIGELQSLLKEKAKKTPAGKWIVGRGWNQNRFKEKRMPNTADLDAASPDNPVILYHDSAMICAVNSLALKLAGVTENTAVPSGGAIDRSGETGKLTGILRDSATNLVWQAVPEPSLDELLEGATLALQKIVEAGITSIHWIVISESELPIIQKLHSRGLLPVRVNVIVPEGLIKKANNLKLSNSSLLRFGGAIIFVDGYLDSKTAALSEPYSDEPSNSGKLLYTKEALAASVKEVMATGVQPVIHAMGDKAVETALNAIEQAKKSTKVRFRIEQAAVLNPQLILRLKQQNVVVTVQPTVIATEFSVWAANQRLGERAKLLHPLKTLFDAGVKVAGGSDCPMEPLNPLLGIQDVVQRKSFSEQRLSVEEALKMYTINAAYCSGEENVKGSIEEGKLADFTVLAADPMTVAPNGIKDIQVSMVIVNGKILS
ncbi:MAG: amidohydrolase [Candidatus Bathyarchaeota archaeon]|nr:amidohydrolase [Candidatus Bathyarchaeota archaeon]